MEVNVFDYVEMDKYKEICSKLKSNEVRRIYSDNQIYIDVKKVGRKVYTFINTFGSKKLNEALNGIYSLA